VTELVPRDLRVGVVKNIYYKSLFTNATGGHMTHRIWTSIGSLSLVWAAGLGCHAQAQETATTPEMTGRPLEEIIVSAQRRSESINEIGMAIQAIDSTQLDALAVANVSDLTAVVPSFTVAQGFQGVPIYTLRGIGFNTINLSATSTVGTYLDEAAYAYPIMNTGPVFDLDRVEVLKGPQGTLYGRNTTAGLINFISAKPTTSMQSEFSAEVGNFETYNASGFVSGPIAENIQGRLAFRVENGGRGWQESNSSSARQGEVERYGARGSLAVQLTDSTNIDFSVNWFLNKSGTIAAQAIGFTPATDPLDPNMPVNMLLNAPGLLDYVRNNVPNDSRDVDFASRAQRSAAVGTGTGLGGPLREDTPFEGFKLRIDQDITANVRLVSLTNYNHLERDTVSDFGGAPFEILVQNTIGKINSFAEDLHLEGETDSGISWLFGAYYANDRILDSNITLLGDNANVTAIRALGINGNPALGIPPLLNGFTNEGGFTATDLAQSFRMFGDFGNIKTESWSVFANADKSLTDQLKLTVGVRYTEEEQRYRGCSRDVNGNQLPNVNVVNRFLFFVTPGPAQGMLAPQIGPGDCVTFDPTTATFGEVRSVLDENNVSSRVVLDYNLTDGTLLYTSFSKGAKAGTTPINAANLAFQNAPVKQERLTAYEVGAKSTLADRRIQVNVSAFYYDYKDKQINTFFADPIFTALARLDNIPKSEAYGLDTDVTWRPLDSLTLNVNLLGLKTEIEEYIGTNSLGQTGIDFSGSEFIYSPEFQGSLSAYYDRNLGSDWGLSAALNVRYQSESNSIFEDLPLYRIPGYAVVNGSIGVRGADDRWSLMLWGRNLLDRYYFNSVANNANTIVRFPSPPRTFGVSFTRKFGQ
jgi:outer membrane receptor protein involved in Fe transport